MLGKYKLNNIKVLISKSLIDSYISHNEVVSVNNLLREYNEIKAWNFCGIYYIKMIDVSRKTYARNGLQTIVDPDGIMWLNENI